MCKHEDLSSSPGTHVKAWCSSCPQWAVPMPVISASYEADTGGLLGLAGCQLEGPVSRDRRRVMEQAGKSFSLCISV